MLSQETEGFKEGSRYLMFIGMGKILSRAAYHRDINAGLLK
jgi:hypothetical protein